jgi:YbbR domain-containing protein
VWIFRNWVYKLSALVVAFLLWAMAQGLESVDRSIDLTIAFEAVPADVVVVEQSAREVNVRLVGSRAAIGRAEKQLSRYPISLEGLKAGEGRFSIDREELARLLPRGAKVMAHSPSAVVVRAEPRVRKLVPVRVDVVGSPPEGYRVAGVRARPSEIELEGARAEMRRIREVLTDRVDVSGLRESAEREVRLVLDSSHVWRADDEGDPVLVEVEIEAPKARGAHPAPGAGGRRVSRRGR